jgi:hypothetical protein
MAKSMFLSAYMETVLPCVQAQFPNSDPDTVRARIRELALASLNDRKALFHNDYEDEWAETSLRRFADFCMGESAPIIVPFGAVYQPHERATNLISEMLLWLGAARKAAKKEMLKHVNDEDKTIHDNYDREQKVVKILMNSYYGASGERNSWFYNPRIGPSVTYAGQHIIQTSIMHFEQFFSGNVPFYDLSEAMLFIHRCMEIPTQWSWPGDLVLEPAGVATHLVHRIKGEVPENAKEVLTKMMEGMDNDQLTRIYFRNNLFAFLREEWVMGVVSTIIDSGETVNPDDPSEAVKPLLDDLWGYLVEWVFYPWVPDNKAERCMTDSRRVVVISDTDSTFLNINPWWDYVCEMYDMEGTSVERRADFMGIAINFMSRSIAEMYSHMTAKMGVPEKERKTISMKNEYLMARIMLTPKKKQYASLIIGQEGKVINPPKLEVKGMTIKKTTASKEARDYFIDVLKNDILGCEGPPDGGAILRKYASFEESVRESIKAGELRFAVPKRYSEPDSYKNPFQMDVVRGAIVWNALFPEQSIQAPSKTMLFRINCEKIEELAPLHEVNEEAYYTIKRVVWDNVKTEKGDEIANPMAHFGWDVIAVPFGTPSLPEWMLPFVDSDTIAAANVRNALPLLESLGFKVVTVLSDNFYSNIVSL